MADFVATHRITHEASMKMLAAGVDPGEVRKQEKIAERVEQDRRVAAMRFTLDSDGALSFRLGKRCMNLTGAETAELRAFLDATRAVIPKG